LNLGKERFKRKSRETIGEKTSGERKDKSPGNAMEGL